MRHYPINNWGILRYFRGRWVATAILDRLLHHSPVLSIRGDSYPLRAKRKSDLIKPPRR
jgi:DNA replication protein DnaC